jgi:DNA-binding protein HU-beta
MNKAQLIEVIANSAELSQRKAADVLDAFTNTVTAELKAGNEVALVGFGTFATKARAARTGRNPQTGETLQIAATTVPQFRPGKTLKDAVDA